MQHRVGRPLISGFLLLVLGVIAPLSNALANGTDGASATSGDTACDGLLVLDFITDANGKTIVAGNPLSAQYKLWGVSVAGETADLQPVIPVVRELPSDTGPVNAATLGRTQAGTLTFLFNNLVSVEAVQLIGVSSDGASLSVYDQNSTIPARVPVTAEASKTLRSVELAMLGGATRLDVDLVAGSGVAQVVLCPLSSPKPVTKQSPQIALQTAVNRTTLNAGEMADVTVTIRNLGQSVGFDLTMVQDLPPGLTFSDDGSRERIWDLGAIGALGNEVISYSVKADATVATGTLTSYVVAMISNGRGAEGVASSAVNFNVTGGRVLGTESPTPTPKASPTPKPSPTPAEPTPTPKLPTATPTPTPATPSEPSGTPSTSVTPEPIGGPAEAQETPAETPTESVTPTPTAPAENASPVVVGGFTSSTASTTATTTGAFGSCTSWLWLLAIVNAVLVGLLARQEQKSAKTPEQAKSRWVIAMLLVAVPLIIWYPACELNWWLVITAVGIGAMLYAMMMGKKAGTGQASGESNKPKS
ncbi:MAG: hypothetical protein PHI63_03585 [Patescibacteria group bacterium]|nr:hypothetical protein [Patescibacteria group bacterium]